MLVKNANATPPFYAMSGMYVAVGLPTLLRLSWK
jgi:hypothetical protein